MIRTTFNAPAWPAGPHRQLLRATLHPDPATARAAWQEWRRAQDFDRIDYASMRLVPLLLARIKELGIVDDDAGRYRGIHRRAWVHSQQVLHRLRSVIEGLEAAGIPTLVLKGAALGTTVYGDTGLRPICDADVLVPHRDAVPAIEWFVRRGWKAEHLKTVAALERYHLFHDHAWAFDAGGDNKIDLHWKLLHLGAHPGLDDCFWRQAIGFRLLGIDARTLSPTHHLFHACVHGVPLCTVPGMRWIADAAMLLRHSREPVDWAEFLRCAADFHVGVIVAHALEYLRREIETPIPEFVLDRLHGASVDRWQHAEYEHLTHHPPSLHPAWLWHRHQRQFAIHPDPAGGSRLGSYLDYVALRWELPDRWHVPAAFVRKVIRHFLNPAPG
jgi:hypothetical protein